MKCNWIRRGGLGRTKKKVSCLDQPVWLYGGMQEGAEGDSPSTGGYGREKMLTAKSKKGNEQIWLGESAGLGVSTRWVNEEGGWRKKYAE